MSACSFEFRQPPSGTREPRADRANRNSQRERRLLVAQTGPGAQREDFLFAPRQLFDEPEHPKHFALGVEPLLNILGKVEGRARLREPGERRRVPPLRATPVPNDVRRDAVSQGRTLSGGRSFFRRRQASRNTIETRSSATAQSPLRRKQEL
jgi:hypothetical protein